MAIVKSAADPNEEADPIVRFYRVAPQGLPPLRADRSALGTLPTSAYQYCEPVCAASAFGWYVFPPMSFHVQWDGTEFIWTHGNTDEPWQPLTHEHFPGLPEAFDARAPEDIRGWAPPFLSSVPQPGVLQIWTGMLVRTRPGWSLLVRPPANLPRSYHYDHYEGIIETDRWLHPLLINTRMITSNRPIFFDETKPLIRAQPLQRSTYEERHLRTFEITGGLDELTPADWDDYRHTIVKRTKDPTVRPGRYSAEVRKRSRSEDEPIRKS